MSLNKTAIEWTDFTWNPVTGCFNNCRYCYARRLAKGRLKKCYLANTCVTKFRKKGNPYKEPFWPRFWEDRLADPLSVSKNFRSRNPNLLIGSAMIFTVDMGDLFGHWVPKRWISEVLKACGKYSQHTFQILTKFPHLAFEYMFPNNVWLGTTVTNVDDLIRINSLINSTASVKFVSIEPLHEDIFPKDDFLLSTLRFIDWIIVGAETGPGREKHFPETQWIHNIIRAAREYQIPLFIKDNLLFLDDESTGIEKIQEFPVIANNEADALLKEVV